MKDFYQLGDELARSYRVLDADNAEIQNDRDIKSWWDSNMLTDQEYHELIQLNRRLHATYQRYEEAQT